MTNSVDSSEEKTHLLLLHLSDIHFEEPRCLNKDTDPDHTIRKILLNDIEFMVDQLGDVDAVVVSGDIAFKGNKKEYDSAFDWLGEVAKISGCQQKDIYTVPGNHDVDRNKVKDRRVLGTRALIDGDLHSRHKEFRETLNDQDAATYLFNPMEEYNQFAAAYSCDIYPDIPFWTQEFDLDNNWKLKIHGLTTTFFSGPEDDKKGELYLGDLQHAFAPDDGIIRLAMLHHPPDWFFDSDEVDDDLWEGCEIQLIGHKHKQRYQATESSVRIMASSVNPDRSERDWEPGYNFIKLEIDEEQEKHFLVLETHIRVWQSSPDRLVPKYTRSGSTVFKHKILLQKKPKLTQSTHSFGKDEIKKIDNEHHTPMVKRDENKGSKMSTRDLVFDFWRKLSASQRRQVIKKLKLLNTEDYKLPETIRYRIAFQKAKEKNIIDSIQREIDQILNK